MAELLVKASVCLQHGVVFPKSQRTIFWYTHPASRPARIHAGINLWFVHTQFSTLTHLQQCLQCNGVDGCNNGNPQVGTPAQNGPGVANTDFVLYISANQTACPPLPPDPNQPTTVAFAGHCQLESTIDRPVAGNVNFCPEGIGRDRNGLQYISSVTKHEILHAIGFSSSLFPYWHDSNGQPRTERVGLQPPSTAVPNTTRQLMYPGWMTRNGEITHTVTAIVTPAVVVRK
jgi:leishmanolysin-like peptidase